MAPLVEDMLREARSGLTEAVVIGPGRAILFYGRHLLGEGLKADKVRDATFLLTGAGTWVGKSAYLTADPMTIPGGKRAIAQAVSDNRVKPRGLWCSPCESAGPTDLPVQCPESISPNRCAWRLQFCLSLNAPLALQRPTMQQEMKRPKASITQVSFTFPRPWFQE